MEIRNSFRVQAPPEKTWDVLNDIERIAPCLPGAQLQEVEGEEYRGIVKVKLGPVVTQYKGTASFAERDEAAHRAVIRARGRETRGQGNANATITAALHPDGTGTRVDILTDLTITGKAAQFGRGMFSEVSQKLINQFAQELEGLLSQEEEPAAAATPSAAGAPDAQPSAPVPGAAPSAPHGQPEPAAASAPQGQTAPREVEALDLTSLAGPAVAKRAAGAAAALFALVVLFGRRRRRRSRGRLLRRARRR